MHSPKQLADRRKNGKWKTKAMKMCGTREESVRDEGGKIKLVSPHFVVTGFCGRG